MTTNKYNSLQTHTPSQTPWQQAVPCHLCSSLTQPVVGIQPCGHGGYKAPHGPQQSIANKCFVYPGLIGTSLKGPCSSVKSGCLHCVRGPPPSSGDPLFTSDRHIPKESQPRGLHSGECHIHAWQAGELACKSQLIINATNNLLGQSTPGL